MALPEDDLSSSLALVIDSNPTLEGVQIDGKLTMNGVTRPVTIAATFTGAGKSPLSGKQTVGFHGMTTIKRSEWGILGALPVVSDNVELTITAAFEN